MRKHTERRATRRLTVKRGARESRARSGHVPPKEASASVATNADAATVFGGASVDPPADALSDFLHSRASEVDEQLSELRAALFHVRSNTNEGFDGALTTAEAAVASLTETAMALRERALFPPKCAGA